MLKSLTKRFLKRAGWDIIRHSQIPENTLLGIGGRPIRTILDIGANVGQSARQYRHLFPKAILYCFEPLPDAYNLLENWASMQQGKVKTFNVALGSDTGHISMHQHVNHLPSSSLLNTTAVETSLYPHTREQVQKMVLLEKLDNFESELTLSEEILVKVDVQGYEGKVIQGGKNVLKRAVGCILEVCLQPLYEEQSSFEELFSAMSNLNYRYVGNLHQTYDQDGSVIYLDAVFLKKACRDESADKLPRL